MNSPVLGSNPTCTVCSKSTGEEISGRALSEGREKEREREREREDRKEGREGVHVRG